MIRQFQLARVNLMGKENIYRGGILILSKFPIMGRAQLLT